MPTQGPPSGPPSGDSPDWPAPATFGTVSILFSAGRTRLVLSGAIDATVGEEMTSAVAECTASALPVDVDARTVTFLDSSGAAHLARLARTLPVRVIQPPDAMRFVLSVTALDSTVEILDDAPDYPVR